MKGATALTDDPRSIVFDLTAKAPVSTFGTQVITLEWTQQLPGDYNGDREVNIAELTTLAQHLGKTVEFRDPSEANGYTWWPSGVPDELLEGYPNPPPNNWALARIDGDRNGVINLADISVIARNYRRSLFGYRVYMRGPGEPGFTQLGPLYRRDPEYLYWAADYPASAWSANGMGSFTALHYEYEIPVLSYADDQFYQPPLAPGRYEFYVAPYDQQAAHEGPASEVVSVEVHGFGWQYAQFYEEQPEGEMLQIEPAPFGQTAALWKSPTDQYEFDMVLGTFSKGGVLNWENIRLLPAETNYMPRPSLAVDASGNNYVGTFGTDSALVSCLDSNLADKWQLRFSALGGYSRPAAVAAFGDQTYLVFARPKDPASPYGIMGICVARIDAAGSVVWQRTLAGESHLVPEAIQAAPDGVRVIFNVDFPATGSMETGIASLSPDGDLRWCKMWQLPSEYTANATWIDSTSIDSNGILWVRGEGLQRTGLLALDAAGTMRYSNESSLYWDSELGHSLAADTRGCYVVTKLDYGGFPGLPEDRAATLAISFISVVSGLGWNAYLLGETPSEFGVNDAFSDGVNLVLAGSCRRPAGELYLDRNTTYPDSGIPPLPDLLLTVIDDDPVPATLSTAPFSQPAPQPVQFAGDEVNAWILH